MYKEIPELADTGERIIPPSDNEISFVFARHQFAYRYASQFVGNCNVVDVGCGTGYGCKIMAPHARFVCGIDYNFDALNYGKRNFESRNICYLQMDARHLGLKRFFDVAVSFQVIEHMSDIHSFIDQVKKMVKPAGKIFISTPNVPRERQKTKGSPFHQKEFDYVEFGDLLSEKFTSFSIYGVAYETRNQIRDIFQKMPFYKLGILLKRRSKIKKLANGVLKLSRFRIVDKDLQESLDFLAICQNV